MIKKAVAFSIILLVATLACGKTDKYADLKKWFADMCEAMEMNINNIEKAENARDIAASMIKNAESLKPLLAKRRELEKRFPEMNNIKNPPGEIEKEIKRFQELNNKSQSPEIMSKIIRHYADPEVIKAKKAFAEILNEF
jgi:hypothetical protein